LSANTSISDNLVAVNLGSRSYDITLGQNSLDQAAKTLGPFVTDRHVVVISDENVAAIYLDQFKTSLASIARRVDSYVVTPGETSKSVATCDQAWQALLEMKTDRDSVVVALGGGVVGDLAGFLAATLGRGIDFIQIPTSLLAQVDSSVGGKVGINLPKSKNMVGAFWQPKSVIIDPLVLSTLDEANFLAGMAEVIKYGLIMDLPLFETIEKSVAPILDRDPQTMTKIIAWCCRCKAKVVEEDETERSGRRAILNYGHTYGHAIESVFGYGKFLHGQAIAIGMTCAGRLARNLGMVDEFFLDRQTKLFQDIGLPTACPTERHDELLAAMMRDKKVSHGKLKLILPTEIGNVELLSAPDDELILESLHND
jgi:3-dehydroquinate synthase